MIVSLLGSSTLQKSSVPKRANATTVGWVPAKLSYYSVFGYPVVTVNSIGSGHTIRIFPPRNTDGVPRRYWHDSTSWSLAWKWSEGDSCLELWCFVSLLAHRNFRRVAFSFESKSATYCVVGDVDPQTKIVALKSCCACTFAHAFFRSEAFTAAPRCMITGL